MHAAQAIDVAELEIFAHTVVPLYIAERGRKPKLLSSDECHPTLRVQFTLRNPEMHGERHLSSAKFYLAGENYPDYWQQAMFTGRCKHLEAFR